MTIKQLLAAAAEGYLFWWWWSEHKPGILFLRSNARPEWSSVCEKYSLPDAEKLSNRLTAAGGDVDMESLREAHAAQQRFLIQRDGAAREVAQ